jgi:hypothetical protein
VYVSVPVVVAVLPLTGPADRTWNDAAPLVVVCGEELTSTVAAPLVALELVFPNETENVPLLVALPNWSATLTVAVDCATPLSGIGFGVNEHASWVAGPGV